MKHEVITGDCLEVLRTLPDASVDSIVTDPPYGIDFQSAWRTDATKRKPKIANDQHPFVWWLHDAARVLKPGGRSSASASGGTKNFLGSQSPQRA